ncbi:MAG: YkgJ family cysteine cluster protein [Thalassobaculales bacterium]
MSDLPLDTVLDQLTTFLRDLIADSLGREASPATLGILADAAREAIDGVTAELTRAIPPPRPLACRSGCTHCCRLPVVTDPLTVLSLAAHIRRSWSAAEIAGLLDRVRAYLQVLAQGLVGGEPRPLCPLLVDGACSAYAHRPLICRSFNAFDAGQCEDAFTRGRQERKVDTYMVPIEVGAALSRGLRAGLQRIGFPDEELELAPALAIALSRDDAAEAWLAGEPVFATAVIAVEARLRQAPAR